MNWIDIKKRIPTVSGKSYKSELLLFMSEDGDIFVGFAYLTNKDEEYPLSFFLKGYHEVEYEVHPDSITHWAKLTPP